MQHEHPVPQKVCGPAEDGSLALDYMCQGITSLSYSEVSLSWLGEA